MSRLLKRDYFGIYGKRSGNTQDGEAIFWNVNKFVLSGYYPLYYEGGTSHLALVGNFIHRELNKKIVVTATHLKAKTPVFQERLTQIKTLLGNLEKFQNTPIIIGADFNEEPDGLATQHTLENFLSAYPKDVITTMKKCDKVYSRCIDYIFYRGLEMVERYELPDISDFKDLLLCANHPSDHLNLGAKFVLN